MNEAVELDNVKLKGSIQIPNVQTCRLRPDFSYSSISRGSETGFRIELESRGQSDHPFY
jgi:hypothetical protein